MKTYKAISVEKENKGELLGTSKRNKFENGRIQTAFDSLYEFKKRMKNSTIYSFEIKII
tara:strand:+ start:16927 stop:17103 length:177 start_codon:yes stop_codon:yes gene_type:complete